MRLLRFVLVDVVEFVLVCLMLALCVDIFLGVFSRYVVGQTMPWYDEVARYLFIWMAFVGAAVAVRRRAHFGVNVLVARWSAVGQRAAAFVCWGLVMAYAVFITVQGLRIMEGVSVQTSPALGLTLSWVFLAIPVHGMLTFLYAAGHFWRTARP
jgi:TRAP-type C4-dicarboxylate transport system permease small subunit